jgi:hypothetical protein
LHTTRFGANASRFGENVRTNNLKISAQFEAHFHALCTKVLINSSLAQRINLLEKQVKIWATQYQQFISTTGLNLGYPIPTIFA